MTITRQEEIWNEAIDAWFTESRQAERQWAERSDQAEAGEES
jgi:hypothetical protein